MKNIYYRIFLLLLFIKPFIRNKYDNDKSTPNVIFKAKLFFIVMISIICMENELVLIALFFLCVFFYLCYIFKNEIDMFLKIIYLIIIIYYPKLH